MMLVIKPHSLVSLPLQEVAPLATGLHQAGAQSAYAPPVILPRTSSPLFLKEDIVATPDLSATFATTHIVPTPA
jgi:hypothetical protein